MISALNIPSNGVKMIHIPSFQILTNSQVSIEFRSDTKLLVSNLLGACNLPKLGERWE